VAAELLFRRGTPPDAEYTFKHALVQDAACGTLLRSRRRQIHARTATTLEGHFPEIVAAQPHFMAQHCSEAGLDDKAAGYRLKAGQQAVARSAMTEATAQLQKGLLLLAPLPKSPARAQQELELQITLGRALMATKGYAAPVVGETIVRARGLAEQLDHPDYLVPLLYSQWVFRMVRGEHKQALLLAEQMEKVGEPQDDESTLLNGHHLHGSSHFYTGEFVAACTLFEQCHGLGEAARRAIFAKYAVQDPHATNLIHFAMALASLGYLDQARARMDEPLSEAQRSDHVFTAVFVRGFACWVDWIAGLPRVAQRRADEAIALSNEHDFGNWLGYGLVHRGWSMTALGQAQEGFALLTEGLSVLRNIGAIVATPSALTMLAEANLKLGRPIEGLSCLTEAAQIIETTEERYMEAELHRERGELLNAVGDRAAAEQNYHQALAVARRQSAKAFELRATTSLARLWRDQGKRTEARDLLAPVYGWFTEGFDTPVLQDAKALLDQLA
jgi:predicted ATPase